MRAIRVPTWSWASVASWDEVSQSLSGIATEWLPSRGGTLRGWGIRRPWKVDCTIENTAGLLGTVRDGQQAPDPASSFIPEAKYRNHSSVSVLIIRGRLLEAPSILGSFSIRVRDKRALYAMTRFTLNPSLSALAWWKLEGSEGCQWRQVTTGADPQTIIGWASLEDTEYKTYRACLSGGISTP